LDLRGSERGGRTGALRPVSYKVRADYEEGEALSHCQAAAMHPNGANNAKHSVNFGFGLQSYDSYGKIL
jgi:hypothetical protein